MSGQTIRTIWVVAVSAAVVALSVVSCGDDESEQDTVEVADVVEEPTTLTDRLALVGLVAGDYVADESDGPVCVKTYTYPGGGRATRAFDLSGFGAFELRVQDEQASLRGLYDEATVRSVDGNCLEYDADVDTLTSIEDCPEEVVEDSCTPFSLLKLCGEDTGPTLTAAIPDCGRNTFSVSPASPSGD